jgi:hypothetical protein
MSEPRQIVIDMAGAMEAITPEMMLAMDQSMTLVLMTRVQQAVKALREIKRAMEASDNFAVFMPDDVDPDMLVEEYIDSVLKELLPGEVQG